MDFSRLPIVLKRYSFEEKMRICFEYSQKTMALFGIKDPNSLRVNPLPWDLETFLIFCIKSNEYQYDNFAGRNERKFLEFINCISAHSHVKINALSGEDRFIDYFLMITGLTQFDLQEYNLYSYYRYNCIFTHYDSNLNMPEVFYSKFAIPYSEFLSIGFLLSTIMSTNTIIDPAVIFFIIQKYSTAANCLIIKRTEYANWIDKHTNSIDDYHFCVRPSYTFPFIEYNGQVSIPLPHLIRRCVTSSLLYRITEGNDQLRSKIGKHVLEKYIYDILYDSNTYDEIYAEQKYISQGTESLTPDVMIRSNGEYLFLDSKAMTPKSKLRLLDENSIDQDIDRLATCIIKLYKQIYINFGKEFYPFHDHAQTLVYDNIWGLVVVLEDSFIRRNVIYERVMKKLNLVESSPEALWIMIHIKIVSLHDIERHAFVGHNIIDSLKMQREEGKFNDYSLTYLPINQLKNQKFILFKKQLSDQLDMLCNELIDNKLLV